MDPPDAGRFEHASGPDANSDDELLEFVRDTGVTIFHPSCTCRMGVDALHTHLRCVARAHEDIQVFVFYAVLPGAVPEPTRPAVAEFVTRANYGFRLGAFEMDYEDGEVRFRAGVDLEGTDPDGLVPLIRSCVAVSVSTADRYFPGLMSVVYGGASAKDAIMQVEGAN